MFSSKSFFRLAAATAVFVACAGGAWAGEDDRYAVAAAVKLRIPFGKQVEARRKTLTFVAGPTTRLDIDTPHRLPPGQNAVLEAGLAFNGDAFVVVASQEVLRAVRAVALAPTRRQKAD